MNLKYPFYLYRMGTPEHIVLFDGICNLCNGAVQFLIKRDRKKQLHFAALQSEAGQELLESKRLSTTRFDSFIYFEQGVMYTRSDAALRLGKYLGGMYTPLYYLKVIPRFIRDGIYNFIARNRYRFFGKQLECMVPTPELKRRFLA